MGLAASALQASSWLAPDFEPYLRHWGHGSMNFDAGPVSSLANVKSLYDVRRKRNNLNELLDPFPFFRWLLNKKAARVEVNRPISLAFLHWVRITFHP